MVIRSLFKALVLTRKCTSSPIWPQLLLWTSTPLLGIDQKSSKYPVDNTLLLFTSWYGHCLDVWWDLCELNGAINILDLQKKTIYIGSNKQTEKPSNTKRTQWNSVGNKEEGHWRRKAMFTWSKNIWGIMIWRWGFAKGRSDLAKERKMKKFHKWPATKRNTTAYNSQPLLIYTLWWWERIQIFNQMGRYMSF